MAETEDLRIGDVVSCSRSGRIGAIRKIEGTESQERRLLVDWTDNPLSFSRMNEAEVQFVLRPGRKSQLRQRPATLPAESGRTAEDNGAAVSASCPTCAEAALVAGEALEAAAMALARVETLHREIQAIQREHRGELTIMATMTETILDLVKEIQDGSV